MYHVLLLADEEIREQMEAEMEIEAELEIEAEMEVEMLQDKASFQEMSLCERVEMREQMKTGARKRRNRTISKWFNKGFVLDIASANGTNIMEAARSGSVDLAFIDVDHLSTAECLTLLSNLQLRKHKSISVIVLGSKLDFSLIKQYIQLGVFDYVVKPVTPDQLLQSACNAIPFLFDDPFEQSHYLQLSSAVALAKTYILSHLNTDLSLTIVAEHIKLHPAYFSALFHKEMGCTFNHYVTMLRLAHAKQLLLHTDESIHSIISKVGGFEEKHFYRVFKKWEGMTPLQYRKQMAFHKK